MTAGIAGMVAGAVLAPVLAIAAGAGAKAHAPPDVPAPDVPAPDAALASPSLEFVFEAEVTLAPGMTAGTTPLGGRHIIPITGGTFSGPALRGTVMPGGWDWQLVRPDGCVQLKADYFLKTDDGVIINIVNTAVACQDGEGRPHPVRTHAVFEAPAGRYDWLNRQTFIGALVPGRNTNAPSVSIRFYRVN